jgi:hypothetical protein
LTSQVGPAFKWNDFTSGFVEGRSANLDNVDFQADMDYILFHQTSAFSSGQGDVSAF